MGTCLMNISPRRYSFKTPFPTLADHILLLLTFLLPAPKALETIKAKFKGLFGKKEKKPAAEPAKTEEAAKPTETTPAPAATTTEAAAPVPATEPAVGKSEHPESYDMTLPIHAYLILDLDD